MSRTLRLIIAAFVLASTAAAPLRANLPRIEVSKNGRHFVAVNGEPFFYLSDTAWGLFTLSREDATHYLEDRAAKRYSVIQAIIGYWGEPQRPEGLPMFLNEDGNRPNESFFEHVDWVIAKAESLGLRIAIVPIWSRDRVNEHKSILDVNSARNLGQFLGSRYRTRSVFWILGGDWTPPPSLHPLWRAMAAGIAEGEGPQHIHLKTYHPRSPESSSFWYHHEPWLGFNMLQTVHSAVINRNYDLINDDYQRTPVKPVLDGEPAYENIDDREARTRVQAPTVRWQAYAAVFAGAAGHTYGADSVYGFRKRVGASGLPGALVWRDALNLEAAGQMQHLRALIESRPMLVRIPDQWLIVNDPGTMADRIQACRADDGSYAFFYTASGRPISARLRLHGYDKISGDRIRCWWFNPRSGEATLIEERPRAPTNERDRRRDDIIMDFTPPSQGAGNDWVLVIDDASRGFSPPGKRDEAQKGTTTARR